MAGILLACERISDAIILREILKRMEAPANVAVRQNDGAPNIRAHFGEIAAAEKWRKIVVLLDGKEKRRMPEVDRTNLPQGMPMCFLFLIKHLEKWIPTLLNDADAEQYSSMAKFKRRAATWASHRLDDTKLRRSKTVMDIVKAVNCRIPSGSHFPADFPLRFQR